MNIEEAKTEIRNTVLAYTRKNPDGSYRIPTVKQRPLLLIGPPGIGKTAIMEQVAQECGVGLVAYTITHHTRQSAIGLPVIREKEYGGKTYSVTEYTMSEIIASVYDAMEVTGKKEGILFIDEINCVSETLAPAMLQFLQCKTFGSHQVPEGWIIAAAGNPPGYNKSIRDFDVVTLDRVRMLQVEENMAVWQQFARNVGVHEAILSFLEIKPQDFYRMEGYEEGMYFVTARGWEDLSQMLYAYEELELPVSAGFVQEFLQYPMVARDFAAYYELYRRYRSDYGVMKILEGIEPGAVRERAKAAPWDERISLVHLLFGALQSNMLKNDRTDTSESKAVHTNKMDTRGSAASQTETGDTYAVLCWKRAFAFLEACYGIGTELQNFCRLISQSPECMEWMYEQEMPEWKRYCQYFEKREQKKQFERAEEAVFRNMLL